MDTENATTEEETPLDGNFSLVTLLASAIVANGGKLEISGEAFEEVASGKYGSTLLMDFHPNENKLVLFLGEEEETDGN